MAAIVSRRRKPSALKVIEGNPGKRKLDGELEPDAFRTLPPPTPFVEEAGREAVDFWHEIGERLIGLGMLSELDIPMFEQLCVARQLWKNTSSEALEDGAPATMHRVADAHSGRLAALLGHFGMSPAMRGKVAAASAVAKPQRNPVLAKIARGRGAPRQAE